MQSDPMSAERTHGVIGFVALIALEGSLARMLTSMTDERLLENESPLAQVTCERSLPPVNGQGVLVAPVLAGKCPAALGALERSLTSMDSEMCYESAARKKSTRTVLAAVRSRARVLSYHVTAQRARMGESL